MLTTCKNCDASLHLDTSNTGPGGWLGIHPKAHPSEQNSICCPGTEDEHEPLMETCPTCDGDGLEWLTCTECEDGFVESSIIGGSEVCECCNGCEEYEETCDDCDGSGETEVEI